jgi:hypothetical protein
MPAQIAMPSKTAQRKRGLAIAKPCPGMITKAATSMAEAKEKEQAMCPLLH